VIYERLKFLPHRPVQKLISLRRLPRHDKLLTVKRESQSRFYENQTEILRIRRVVLADRLLVVVLFNEPISSGDKRMLSYIIDLYRESQKNIRDGFVGYIHGASLSHCLMRQSVLRD
jgi:hypothetical protein